jgi:fatty-acyl-CoA synthase
VPWGDQGEIWVRGYLVMKCYWDDVAKTKETIDEDGWINTGDLGFFDEDGFLKINGRAKDMIIRGGENVYPKEIEEFYMRHTNIEDIQVVGINDHEMGEELCAWIKLKVADQTKAADIVSFGKGKIAHFKIPRYVRFVKEFPMTVTGKVKKNDMRHITNELITKNNSDIIDIKPRHKL